MAVLSGLGSRYMCSFFDLGFSMTINEFTHTVGSPTFLITPVASISSRVSLHISLMTAGWFLGGLTTQVTEGQSECRMVP